MIIVDMQFQIMLNSVRFAQLESVLGSARSEISIPWALCGMKRKKRRKIIVESFEFKAIRCTPWRIPRSSKPSKTNFVGNPLVRRPCKLRIQLAAPPLTIFGKNILP